MSGYVDFIINDGGGWEGRGPIGQALQETGHGQVRFDPGMLRPFIDDEGHRVVSLNTGRYRYDEKKQRRVPIRTTVRCSDLAAHGYGHPVHNATTMRKEDWIQVDRAVVKATRQRMTAWDDLRRRSSRGGFNAMAKTTLEYEAMTDPGEAVVDMDGIADARTDRPLFKLRSVPLPITHADYWFSRREIAVSENSSTPLDTTMGEACGRRVGEMIERTLIGTVTGMTYGTQTAGYGTHDGTSTVYGYTNYPNRVTKTDLHTPTTANPENVVEDVIEMRETMYSNGFFGPFVVYYSTGYDRFLDDDYFRTGGTSVTRTLRERLESITGIESYKRLDFLTSGYQLIMVQITSDVVQAIDGMDITTVMWETRGGMQINFKVMCIQVPLLKAPYNGVAGIIHGTTS
jgi:hypothetical protein